MVPTSTRARIQIDPPGSLSEISLCFLHHMIRLDVLYKGHQKVFFSVKNGRSGGRSMIEKNDFFEFFSNFCSDFLTRVRYPRFYGLKLSSSSRRTIWAINRPSPIIRLTRHHPRSPVIGHPNRVVEWKVATHFTRLMPHCSKNVELSRSDA